jgi:hypothetical protein
MGNTPRPPQQRAERMKVLEEEVDQLQRVEEVLIAREGAERLTNFRASGRAWRAGNRRTRRSRRVTHDQQRDLAPGGLLPDRPRSLAPGRCICCRSTYGRRMRGLPQFLGNRVDAHAE